jgi:hypothetical protein
MGSAAMGRPWEDRWRAGGPPPANRDTHSPYGDSRAGGGNYTGVALGRGQGRWGRRSVLLTGGAGGGSPAHAVGAREHWRRGGVGGRLGLQRAGEACDHSQPSMQHSHTSATSTSA